ncbi:hypothetical protein [Salmonella enterica]|uniref:hypothetical protein n=1 Tax=Salmonella enterica TaxID=28901 RepID=UPI0014838234|nr:hypothetical protein [Salmonella enterica]
MSNPQINETVEHRLSDNLQSKQPAYVNLNLGGRNYRAFVEDIDNGQGAMADLDAEF